MKYIVFAAIKKHEDVQKECEEEMKLVVKKVNLF